MSKYVGAVGIAVDDLDVSAAFYTNTLGMTALQTIELPTMKEIIMGFEGTRSAAVILMKYTDGTTIPDGNQPGKIVFYVDDTAATLDAVREIDGTVESEAKAVESMGGAIIGFARDPDGHQLELIQKPPKS
ncbi:MAG: VOC family protein [Pseudomonadota bacterium]